MAADGRNAFFLSFAEDAYYVRVAVPGIDVHTNELGHTQAGRVHRFE
jgi:hypothetical protein